MLTSVRLCSVHSLAVSKFLVTRIAERRFVPEPICADPEAVSGLERHKYIEKTFLRPRELIPDSIPSLTRRSLL